MLERLKRAARARIIRAVIEANADRFDHQDAELRALRERVEVLSGAMHDIEFRDRRDIHIAADRAASASSAEYVNRAMAGARSFADAHETLTYGVSQAPTGGLALEFGVFSGRTLALIAGGRDETVYGFDSFAGLPEHWRPGFAAGTFETADLPDVEGAELVVGLFADTLPGFLAAHPGPVDVLHVDCDLYSSTVTVLEHVGPRLRPGSIVVFDEYVNHPTWQDGEFRAWREYVERTGTSYEYLAYTFHDEQVVVRVTGV